MPDKMYDVPVLMYHSVGIPDKKWKWNYLTCPFDRFEEQLKAIQELGFTTISLNSLYDYMVEGKDIPKKSIALTFDDGYLDNWIFAYPLLKKYGMCGTVFINPDFVDKREIKRKQYTEHTDLSELETAGFLSWQEIIQMDREGILYAESHALTHTWYPVSNKVIDFRHPGDPYIWMSWNAFPEEKPKLQMHDSAFAALGAPVYENMKSLMSPRFYPDQNLEQYLVSYVEKNGGMQFFNQKNWKDILMRAYELYTTKNRILEYYEDQESYLNRIRQELKYTKDLLEEKLNKKITFLCWPGGSATKVGMQIAGELGYTFFNTARDMTPVERKNTKNVKFGGNRVNRFTPFMFWDGNENFNSKVIYANKLWMKIRLTRHSEKYASKYWFKLIQTVVDFYYNIKLK